MSDYLKAAGAIILGFLAGCVLWAILLTVQVQRHAPGLWTVRVQRILDCGLDYNGPAYTHSGVRLWLTCGSEDTGWQLFPLQR
jgi:hypothetical protein